MGSDDPSQWDAEFDEEANSLGFQRLADECSYGVLGGRFGARPVVIVRSMRGRLASGEEVLVTQRQRNGGEGGPVLGQPAVSHAYGAPLPDLWIRPQDPARNFYEELSPGRVRGTPVEVESEEFNRWFRVVAPDAFLATAFLSADMMSLLIDRFRFVETKVQGSTVCLTGWWGDTGVAWLVALLGQLLQRIPAGLPALVRSHPQHER